MFPETRSRQQTELEIRLLEGVSLAATRGYLSAEVRENYARAQWLCEQVGDARQLFEIAHAACYALLSGPDEDEARRGIEGLTRIAQRVNTADSELRAEVARGRLELWTGHFGIAVGIFRTVLERISAESVEFRPGSYGVHPVFAAHAHAGVALWIHGFPDRAHEEAIRGVAHAEQSGRLLDLASGLCHLAFVELVSGRTDAAASAAARAMSVCRDHEIAYFRPLSQFFAGAALLEHGDFAHVLVEMTRTLAEHRVISGTLLTDLMLVVIADAHARSGHWDEGLARADEGLAITEQHLSHTFAAELWRTKGELLVGQARSRRARARLDAAEACFRRALEIARQQEANSFVLRAALSLARLTGERDVLRAAYASFTEGFDTQDLRAAKALFA
jgi:adenylate cyclase